MDSNGYTASPSLQVELGRWNHSATQTSLNHTAALANMSNTPNQIPVDKTWNPTESSRKIKSEVQSSPLELPEV